MDYETVIRCYLEMKSEGAYAVDVSELLIEEILSSSDFSDYEQAELLQKIREWQTAAEANKSEMMAIIEKYFGSKNNFRTNLRVLLFIALKVAAKITSNADYRLRGRTIGVRATH